MKNQIFCKLYLFIFASIITSLPAVYATEDVGFSSGHSYNPGYYHSEEYYREHPYVDDVSRNAPNFDQEHLNHSPHSYNYDENGGDSSY